MQLKRCFLTIHQGMLDEPFINMPDNETCMILYFDELKKMFTVPTLGSCQGQIVESTHEPHDAQKVPVLRQI